MKNNKIKEFFDNQNLLTQIIIKEKYSDVYHYIYEYYIFDDYLVPLLPQMSGFESSNGPIILKYKVDVIAKGMIEYIKRNILLKEYRCELIDEILD